MVFLRCSAFVIPLKDRTTKQTVTLSGKGKILPLDFGIVQVGFFADPEARLPISAIGGVGDAYYLHFALVGFERAKESKQPDLAVSMRILDEQGKPTRTKSLTGKVNADVDPKEI